jgi:hypothetical protein
MGLTVKERDVREPWTEEADAVKQRPLRDSTGQQILLPNPTVLPSLFLTPNVHALMGNIII